MIAFKVYSELVNKKKLMEVKRKEEKRETRVDTP